MKRAQENIKATDGHDIIVLGRGNWGRGKDLESAKKEARKHGSIKEGEYIACFVPEGTEVDENGYTEAHVDKETHEHKQCCHTFIHTKSYKG